MKRHFLTAKPHLPAIHRRFLPILLALPAVCACSDEATFDAQGTFEAVELTISSETAGRLLFLPAEEGDSLSQGDVVAQIDTVLLSWQRATLIHEQAAALRSRPDVQRQIASLREQISGAETEQRRAEALLADGATTQKHVDDVQNHTATLRSQLDGLLSQLATSTASTDEQAAALGTQIENLSEQIRRSTVRAPRNGFVVQKYAEQGELVAAGTPLLRVADLHSMYLRAYFTSEQLATLRLGQKVRVVADYGGSARKDYVGTVAYIATKSEFTPKTIETRSSRAELVYAVKIRVPYDGLLKIGLTGEVYVED